MKKIVSLFLSAFLLLSSTVMVFASPSELPYETSISTFDELSEFISCINTVICDAEQLGLTSDDFVNIYLGFPIHTYEITLDGNLQANTFDIYPVFSENRILFEILKTADGATQVSQCFSNVLSPFEAKNISIIYDANHAYIVEDNLCNIQTAFSFCDYSGNRGEFDIASQVLTNAEINWALVARDFLIPASYIGVQPAYDATYPPITLPTPTVMQIADRICWAASVASIGNYRTSSNYTAQYVAQQHFGTDYNQYGSLSLSMDMLRSIYGVSYQFYSNYETIDDDKIYRNLSEGYPLFGRWETGSTAKHQTVIRGLNVTLGRLYLMDPEIGYVQASKQGGNYSYVGASGNTLTFMGYASKYYY